MSAGNLGLSYDGLERLLLVFRTNLQNERACCFGMTKSASPAPNHDGGPLFFWRSDKFRSAGGGVDRVTALGNVADLALANFLSGVTQFYDDEWL